MRCPPLPFFRNSLWLAILAAGLGLALIPSAWASGKKKRDPVIAIRFHAQVNVFDPTFAARARVGEPPREIIVEKIPSLSERDIASFYPYRAQDGSYSVVLQLDVHGGAVLEGLSVEKRGLELLVAVNGRPITTLLIDKKISDGVIFIPYGLSEADIRAMGASFSLMGETEAETEARKHPQKPAGPFDDPTIPVETPKPR